MEAKRLLLDVFGRRVIVESTPEGWSAFYPGNDGKRRPVDIAIPSHLDESGIIEYLDDLFHEHATAEQPAVRILSNSPIAR